MRALGRLTPSVLLLVLVAGCSTDEGLRARYEAERARYWAERNDIRFALESNPDIRAQYAASAVMHEGVAALAKAPAGVAEPLREDFRLLRGEALLRAGEARLNAGQWELAAEQLRAAMQEAPQDEAIEAAWLLGEALLGRDRNAEAMEAFDAIFAILIDGERAIAPPERFLSLPVRLAKVLDASGETELLEKWLPRAREIHTRLRERWVGTWTERRLRFLDHRLSLVADDPQRAVRELAEFEAWAEDPIERDRAMLARAELLAARLGEYEQARALQTELAGRTRDVQLRSLARLRLGDLELLEGRTDAAADSFRALTKGRNVTNIVISAAEARLARIQREAGDLVGAIQSYRRIAVRFGDTPAGLRAPMEIIALAESGSDSTKGGRGAGLDVRRARHQAAEQFRRVLDLHPGDSPVGLLARERLVFCLVGLGRADEALLECEQLYHVVGPTPRGLQSLVRAGSIATDALGRDDLARRYWERVRTDAPASLQAAEAERLLGELGPVGSR